MDEPSLKPPPAVPAEAYTRDYYETCCQGYTEFKTSRGQSLPLRLALPLELADIQPGMAVVDVGCGRGELVLHCAKRGGRAWGLDYARPALNLAQEALGEHGELELRKQWAFSQTNALAMPFASSSVDVVFMLDVVEHLYPHELRIVLDEVWRILRPDGRLVVHTMPNLWYYHYGYPVYRLLQRLRGEVLPIDPRDRWLYSHVHVNEQDPQKLRLALRQSRFKAKVWLRSTQSYRHERNFLVRVGMEVLTRVYPFRRVFCNDIFAIGIKYEDRH